MTSTETPRIYVASLSDYNAGRLHGKWFDVTDFADGSDLYDAVKEQVLDTSKEMVAEEWAIHDYEGFSGLSISEYENFDNVVALAEAIEEHGGALAAWLDNDSSRGPEDIEQFLEQFCGEWDSEKAYTEDFICECGFGDLPAEIIAENLSYIDVDHIKHEMFDVGDYWSAKTPDYNVWVFNSAA